MEIIASFCFKIDFDKLQKYYESLKSRGADESNIIKKLLFKGFKYEDIKKVIGKE